jgi:hypothetical protein
MLYSVDLSTQRKIHETNHFAYYSEDERDYVELVELIEAKNAEFARIFGTEIEGKISIYIFATQSSFAKHVFHSDIPVLDTTGFADHRSKAFYITSYYDTCKTKERLMQTPIHELVHIYFPHEYIWIREGIACYFADMLFEIPSADYPERFSDLRFYVDGVDGTRKAYYASAWLIKYVFEELCNCDMRLFRRFARYPDNYWIFGIDDEQEFFLRWRKYMSNPN